MKSQAACATCASTFDSPTAALAEQPLMPGRDLQCCGRSICARCLNQNKRYETYCPYCQISTGATPLPQGLRDPPPYSLQETGQGQPSADDDALPAYSDHATHRLTSDEKTLQDDAPDVLHFLTPNDSILSLSLAYGVPIEALRKANHVFSDRLLQGRKTVVIPGEFYKGGVSLSPEPIEGEEEEIRRTKVRRWMVACKVAEYDVATLYLDQSGWNLETAIAAYRDDEKWETDHPLAASSKARTAKNVGMRRFVGAASNTSRSRP